MVIFKKFNFFYYCKKNLAFAVENASFLALVKQNFEFVSFLLCPFLLLTSICNRTAYPGRWKDARFECGKYVWTNYGFDCKYVASVEALWLFLLFFVGLFCYWSSKYDPRGPTNQIQPGWRSSFNKKLRTSTNQPGWLVNTFWEISSIVFCVIRAFHII